LQSISFMIILEHSSPHQENNIFCVFVVTISKI